MKLLNIFEDISKEHSNEMRIFLWKNNNGIFLADVDTVWKYREFDRCGKDNISSKEYFLSLEKDIQENGVTNPIIFFYDIFDESALVVEGNHRLCISKSLGIKKIPLKLVFQRMGKNYEGKKVSLPLKDLEFLLEYKFQRKE